MNAKMNHWWTFAICWVTGTCAGMNANLFSVLLTPVITTLAETSDKVMIGQLGSYAITSFLMGWAIGGIIIGTASDRFGRVRAMAFAVALYSVFSACAAGSQSVSQFILCRFIIGLGVGGAMVNMSVLLSESWPNKTRAIAVGSLLTSYQAGVFASGVLVHFIPEWRMAFAAGSIPVVLAGVILFGLQEKPKTIQVQAISREKGDWRSLVFGSILFGSLLVGYWASASWIPTWIQDLTENGNVKSTATMWHGIAAVCGCLIAGPLVMAFGRTKTAAVAFLLAFITSASMLWMYQEFTPWVYVSFSLLGIAIGTLQSTLNIYLPELFPSYIRGRNVGICLNTGRVITACSVLFVGALVPLLGGYEHGIMLFAMAYLIGAGITFACKETRLQELPV